jgi:hypothetical protein
MGSCKQHTVVILLDVKDRRCRYYTKIEILPPGASVGSAEDAHVGPGDYRVTGRVGFVDEQAQNRDVRKTEIRLRPVGAHVDGLEDVANTGG